MLQSAAPRCINAPVQSQYEGSSMPSFDVVSEVDQHELTNAVDQASREVTTRFDFKGVDATFEFKDNVITLSAKSDFQIEQMLDILRNKVVKRGIDLASLKRGDKIEVVGQKATLKCSVVQGIEAEIARKIVKHVKELKMKVQAAIQGDKLRITGAKRDDLQKAIAELRRGEFGVPLQFDNFRD
jgi:uncharacterized protein YajQ (UPF0234 family)